MCALTTVLLVKPYCSISQINQLRLRVAGVVRTHLLVQQNLNSCLLVPISLFLLHQNCIVLRADTGLDFSEHQVLSGVIDSLVGRYGSIVVLPAKQVRYMFPGNNSS